MRRICVAHDCGERSADAALVAAQLAGVFGAVTESIHVDCHAPDDPTTPSEQLALELLGAEPARHWTRAELIGLLTASPPELVVTSLRGVSRLRDRFTRSAAHRLAHGAPCPVLFVAREAAIGDGPMLLASRDAPTAGELALAGRLSSALGAQLIVTNGSARAAIRAAARYQPGAIVLNRALLRQFDWVAGSVLAPVVVVPHGARVPV